jgi:hypothetical protein
MSSLPTVSKPSRLAFARVYPRRQARSASPPKAVLGYISDLPEEGAGAIWFAGARHALAPRLLVPLQNPQKQDWILGNFSKSVDLHQIETQNQLQLVRDFGSGVAVFRSR